MAVFAPHAGMKQPDVDAAGYGRGIGRGQVFRDGGLGEALPVDRHAQIIEPYGLGTLVGQQPDIIRQTQRTGHLVVGIVVAGDDE